MLGVGTILWELAWELGLKMGSKYIFLDSKIRISFLIRQRENIADSLFLRFYGIFLKLSDKGRALITISKSYVFA